MRVVTGSGPASIWLCYPSGVMDTFRLPKFSAEFFASQRPNPFVFIASHWTDASNPVVTVFGHCESVALYFDEDWVETRQPYTGYPTAGITSPPFYFVEVPNERGTLRAECLVDGAVVASHEVQSPEEADSLHVRTSFAELRADGSDMAFVYAEVRDANGTVLPNSEHAVRFTVAGGTLASPAVVAAEAGVATALVRTSETRGELLVTTSVDGLRDEQLSIPTVPVDDLYK